MRGGVLAGTTLGFKAGRRWGSVGGQRSARCAEWSWL